MSIYDKTRKSMFWGKCIKTERQNIDDKKDIKIYICIDLPYVIDTIQFLNNIRDYIQENHKDIYISKVQEIVVNMPAHVVFDVLQEGMDIFTRMTRQIPLEEENIWFMYVSAGIIKRIIYGCTVVLLNDNPKDLSCKYIINRNYLNIMLNNNDELLNENYKILKDCVKELITNTDNVISYENLEPIYKN